MHQGQLGAGQLTLTAFLAQLVHGLEQQQHAELALVHAPGLVFSCNTTLILGV